MQTDAAAPSKPLTKKAQKMAEIEFSKTELRRFFPKGSKLYVIIRKVSSTGMSRTMTPLVLIVTQRLEFPVGDLREDYGVVSMNPGRHIANVLPVTYVNDGNHSVRVNGCGMNMAFWLAYELGRALYQDGDAIKHEIL